LQLDARQQPLATTVTPNDDDIVVAIAMAAG
jgi:hypothetical protein